MSKSGTPLASGPVFNPWTFVAAFLATLVLLACLGARADKFHWYDNFVRFTPNNAPDTKYEPTLAEMESIVRQKCRPDQILVVVGGNSILLGVGQPVQKLWTARLQEMLGPEYVVINFALRGACPTDGGALLAEALRDEYPKQIYIANMAPMQNLTPVGLDTYRFLTLEAFHKRRLIDFAPRTEAILARKDSALPPDKARELELRARADGFLYFRDLWTWTSYRFFSTYPASEPISRKMAYKARRVFPDTEPDFETMPKTQRYTPEIMKADLEISRAWTSPYYQRNEQNGWVLYPAVATEFEKRVRTSFPEPLRGRTLLLVSRNSPFYTRQLEKDIQERENLGFADTVRMLEAGGYHAMEYGKDFADDDYGDRTHLTASGGKRLAALIAPEIRSIAASLGYNTAKKE
jgi:hypothetical protein